MAKKKENGYYRFIVSRIIPFGLYGGGLWTATSNGLWLPGGVPADNPPLIAVIGGWVSLIGFLSFWAIPAIFADLDRSSNNPDGE